MPSQYEKLIWEDRIVENPFSYIDELSNEKTFTPNPGIVTEEGTAITAERMNHIENQIENLSNIYGASSNATDDYSITLTNTNFELSIGQDIDFVPDVGNNGSCTLNVNSTGVVTLRKYTRSGIEDLITGDLIANSIYHCIYDGTYWIVTNPTERIYTILSMAGDIIYASASYTPAKLAKGTAYQQLGMNSSSTFPEWQPSSTSVLTTQGDILYASAANTLARLPKGTNGQVLKMNTAATAPTWANSNEWQYCFNAGTQAANVTQACICVVGSNLYSIKGLVNGNNFYRISLTTGSVNGLNAGVPVGANKNIYGLCADPVDTDYIYAYSWDNSTYIAAFYRYSIINNNWTNIGNYTTSYPMSGGLSYCPSTNRLVTFDTGGYVHWFNKSTANHDGSYVSVSSASTTIAIIPNYKFAYGTGSSSSSITISTNYTNTTSATSFGNKNTDQIRKVYGGSHTSQYLLMLLQNTGTLLNDIIWIFDAVTAEPIKIVSVPQCYTGCCWTDGTYIYISTGTGYLYSVFKLPIR